ncbi:unnamed protein product [Vicia faba]|nr:unnamed protein product [Vicia faba]
MVIEDLKMMRCVDIDADAEGWRWKRIIVDWGISFNKPDSARNLLEIIGSKSSANIKNRYAARSSACETDMVLGIYAGQCESGQQQVCFHFDARFESWTWR